VLPLKTGTVFAFQMASGIAFPLPGELESGFLKPQIAMEIITAIISLFSLCL